MYYELTLRSTYLGQQCVNRFNYWMPPSQPALGLNAFGLADAFGLVVRTSETALPEGTPMFAIRSALVGGVNFTSFDVRELYDVSDFFSGALPAATDGLYSASLEALPPFAAFGFRSNRVRQDIRRATKRFAGVAEALQAGGTITEVGAGYTSEIAFQMERGIFTGVDASAVEFRPIVIKRVEYTTPSGKSAYKYPAEADIASNFGVITSYEPYSTVRSQVSRQFGRGQ